MATTDQAKGFVEKMSETMKALPLPNAPEFASIRGELAPVYIRHKVELKMADWSDGQIAARVSDITAAMVGCSTVAMARGDKAWLDRHPWFAEAAARLFNDQQAVPLGR